MDAYVILGNPYAGKSTTARHLTGRARTMVSPIAMINSGNRIEQEVFVQLGSLQEQWITPAAFLRDVSKTDAEAVCFAIWIRGRGDPNYPRGVEYLRSFRAAGWNIKYVDALSVDRAALLPEFNAFAGVLAAWPHSRAAASNVVASDIRSRWNWV